MGINNVKITMNSSERTTAGYKRTSRPAHDRKCRSTMYTNRTLLSEPDENGKRSRDVVGFPARRTVMRSCFLSAE